MPPDAIVTEGPALATGPARGVWTGTPPGTVPRDATWAHPAELREAALRREVARLTRERNHLLAAPGGRGTADVRAGETVSALEQQTRRDAARLAAKDELIRALYGSRSWRLASPLRMLAALLGRGAAPGAEAAIAQTDAALASVQTPRDLAVTGHLRRRPEGSGRGEVLVVAPHLPLFDRQSGGLRLTTLIGLIASLGWSVTFCSSCPAASGPDLLADGEARADYERALHAIGVARFVYGLDGIRTFLIEAGGRMRYAFLSFPEVACDVMPIVRTHCPWARVIFDTVDLHFLRMEREATLRGDSGLHHRAEAMRRIELACLRSADVTVAVTEDERRLLLDLVPEAVVETLPNVFRVPPGVPPGPEGRRGLLFVGGFRHTPNADAVFWFTEHIWPRIRARAPGLVFRIAGADPTPEVRALGRHLGIEVLGYVPDLSPLFDAARVFVAPLRFGAGMKGKVGQSLIQGLPVVTTPIGAEGMALEDGHHLLLATDPEAFADHVLALLRDDALWRRLQSAGRALIEATLSEALVARRLEAMFHV